MKLKISANYILKTKKSFMFTGMLKGRSAHIYCKKKAHLRLLIESEVLKSEEFITYFLYQIEL